MQILDHCLPFLCRYRALICDIWGVLHDGVKAYPDSNLTLSRYRAQGGKVVLLSNSPQVGWQIDDLLVRKKVQRSVYDALVTSGDLTIEAVRALNVKRVFHLGPERHMPLYENQTYERCTLADAQAVVCTGFFNDDTSEFDSYTPLLQQVRERGLPLVCGNPDVVVDVGGTLELCAGAIAKRYEDMGGRVIRAGKPDAMAYRAAQEKIDALCGMSVPRSDIVALGDALVTDIKGAQDYGVDRLFVAQGIHRQDVAPHGKIEAKKLETLFTDSGLSATAAAFSLK